METFFDLLEMAWRKPQMNIVTLVQLLRIAVWTKNVTFNGHIQYDVK